MRELESTEQDKLLPQSGEWLFIVLFYRSSDSESLEVRGSCEITGNGVFEAIAVDLDRAPQIAGWFKIQSVPVLAAIVNGAILGLDFDVSNTACHHRLIERAIERRHRLLGGTP